MRFSSILGLNARFQHYSYPYNSRRGKAIALSKILTKKKLSSAGIAVPAIYTKFVNPRSVLSFDWESLPDSFALKPSRGLGGEGIILAKKKGIRSRPRNLDYDTKGKSHS